MDLVDHDYISVASHIEFRATLIAVGVDDDAEELTSKESWGEDIFRCPYSDSEYRLNLGKAFAACKFELLVDKFMTYTWAEELANAEVVAAVDETPHNAFHFLRRVKQLAAEG